MPDSPYKRIVSLVPSLTELLIDLGLKDHMVGRTRFCIHPEDQVEDIEIIGGTKNPRLEKIIELEPDFILANKEENEKEDVEILTKYAEVMVTEIDSVSDAVEAIGEIGRKFEATEKAGDLTEEISELITNIPRKQPLRTAYFIWKDPWMTVGYDTYIHDVLQLYALENIYADQDRYPTTSLQKLADREPGLILLSSEPYPFKEKHIAEIQEACPDARIELVNGEWFSWYGSRMVQAFQELNTWREAL